MNLAIDPGSRAVFGSLELEGLENVKADYVRRQVTWKEGELYDQRKVDETRRTLVARLFAERDDAERIRELLDENDRRLDEAVRLTRQLLPDPECG